MWNWFSAANFLGLVDGQRRLASVTSMRAATATFNHTYTTELISTELATLAATYASSVVDTVSASSFLAGKTLSKAFFQSLPSKYFSMSCTTCVVVSTLLPSRLMYFVDRQSPRGDT